MAHTPRLLAQLEIVAHGAQGHRPCGNRLAQRLCWKADEANSRASSWFLRLAALWADCGRQSNRSRMYSAGLVEAGVFPSCEMVD